jgi:uracil-DNA glycosylase
MMAIISTTWVLVSQFQEKSVWLFVYGMPIFHPSYLLRNPAKVPDSPKALMWDDIREVRRKYDELIDSSLPHSN